ncbi:hypothetical protein LMG32289_02808 [Cupriavidus pampae]|uniref:Uncharacterized protein n=1 Tax=Cupriavidus pampae TaxID=659251 RepID=A0ABN7YM12_9BURK|nr:hypothetical protein LMG32289_02808 [Cupriavidus pampae]
MPRIRTALSGAIEARVTGRTSDGRDIIVLQPQLRKSDRACRRADNRTDSRTDNRPDLECLYMSARPAAPGVAASAELGAEVEPTVPASL